MRKTTIALAILAAAFILGACAIPASGGGVTAYALKVAPKAITVDVPASLVKPATTAARSLSASKALGGAQGFFNNENRGAYHWIKESMWQAQKRLARAASKLVLVDSVITANGLVAGTAAAPTHQPETVDHVWTDAEVAAIQALLPASFAGNAGFESDAKLPKAGDKVTLPAFDYGAVDPADAVNAAYAMKVVFSTQQSEDDSSSAIQETNDFYWTADKSGFKYSHEKSDVTAPAAPIVLEMNFVAYDGGTATLAAGRQAKEGSISLQVKADPASTKSGVFISFSSTILADKAEDYQSDSSVNSAGTTFAINAEGYADDAGGYVDETLVLTAGGTSSTYYFRESFDAAGKLTLAQSSADATFANLTTIAGVQGEDSGASVDGHAYDAKESAVKTEHHNMDTQGPGQEIRKEEKRHAGEMHGSGFEIEFAPASGQADPVVGDTWGVFDSAALSNQIGGGTITEPGKLRAIFTAKPADGVNELFIARLASGVADPSEVIAVPFQR